MLALRLERSDIVCVPRAAVERRRSGTAGGLDVRSIRDTIARAEREAEGLLIRRVRRCIFRYSRAQSVSYSCRCRGSCRVVSIDVLIELVFRGCMIGSLMAPTASMVCTEVHSTDVWHGCNTSPWYVIRAESESSSLKRNFVPGARG
jgi:hypothetical protein